MLHVETVGTVTSPVTHDDVVAVKREFKNPTDWFVLELIGSINKHVPININTKKLSINICVVDNLFLIFKTISLSYT